MLLFKMLHSYNYAVFIIAMITVVQGMPTGAPESACETLQPNHKDHKPQPASTFPYLVTMSKDSYTSTSDKITVTLQSSDGTTAFKGFLLAARNEAGKPVGTWTKTSSGHELTCSAVTHNNNNDKTTVSLTWNPPTNATSGKITVVAAVVQNVSTFWVNIPVKVGSVAPVAARRSSTIDKATVVVSATVKIKDNGKVTTGASSSSPLVSKTKTPTTRSTTTKTTTTTKSS